MIAYTVIASLPDEKVASEYIDWLKRGHLTAVLSGGATSAEIVRVHEPAQPIQVETRYQFPSSQAYDRYLREHAPRLRAEGLAKFGPGRHVRFERRLGQVM